MNKKNVLVVISYYYPYVSGLTEYAKIFAEELSKEYNVTVLTGRHEPNIPLRENLNGVDVIRVKPLFFLHKGYVSLEFFVRFRELAKKSDLVHFHLPMLESGLLVSLVPMKTPIIATYQCDVVHDKGLIDKIATTMANLSHRRCIKKVDRIVVSSNDYANGSPVLKGFENIFTEIYPPGQTIKPDLSIDRSDELEAGIYRIGFLGRFVREKGIDVLVKAIPKVVERFPKAVFMLGGNYQNVAGGSIYNEIKDEINRLSSNIKLLGKISNEEINQFYNNLDILVLPSVNSYEAFGMVQVEAMMTGALVISTDRRGIRVPIQKTGNGKIVEPGNPDALADAIIELLENAKMSDRKSVIQKVNEVFAHSIAFDKYRQLYRKLTE